MRIIYTDAHMIQSFVGRDKTKNEEAIKGYKKALQQRSDLNLKYEQAMLENKRNYDSGIAPVPQYKSAEEESRDTANQLMKARNILKEQLYPSDVNDVITKLNTDGHLNLFIKFYTQFFDKLKWKTGLSAAEFFAAWQKYLDILEKSDFTGIEQQGIDADVLKEVRQLTSSVNSRTKMNEILEEVNSMDFDDLYDACIETYEIVNKTMLGGSLDGVTISIPASDINTDVYKSYPLQKDRDKYISKTPGVGAVKTGRAIVQYIAYYRRDVYIIDYIMTKNPTLKNIEDYYTPLIIPEADVVHDKKIVMGKGICVASPYEIDTPMQHNVYTPFEHPYKEMLGCHSMPRYVPLGEYDVHAYRLEDNVVSLHARRTHTRSRTIEMFKCSDLFKEMLLDLLYNKQMDKNDYDMLSDDEVGRLHAVTKVCRLPMREVLGKNNKRSIEAAGDKDIKRFDVLKGEILAGNNSPDLIKELKMLLFKLNSAGVVSKENFDELMQIILSL